MNPGNGDGRGGGLLGGLTPGGAASVGDENRLPTISETKAPWTEKDGPMPIHGKLFMGLYREWASQKLIWFSVSARLFPSLRPKFHYTISRCLPAPSDSGQPGPFQTPSPASAASPRFSAGFFMGWGI